MRLIIIGLVAGLCLTQAAEAADKASSGHQRHTLSAELRELMPDKIAGDRVIFVSAGVVFAGLWMNFMTGGMFGAVLGLGSASAPVASVATFAVGETVWHGTVYGLGPAAIVSVGQPVDAALRDPYATSTTYADAFKESGRRAEDLAVRAGSYVSTTVGNFLNRF